MALAAGPPRTGYFAPMTTILYGIPNCDTVKKARDWLQTKGVAYKFHDYKKAGIDEAHLRAWSQTFGWDKVLNRAGTTFKALPAEHKADLGEDNAIALMLAQPSMIKRPILEHPGGQLIGFKAPEWDAALG